MTVSRADRLPQDAGLAYASGSTTGAAAWSDGAVIRLSREGGVRLGWFASGWASVERRNGESVGGDCARMYAQSASGSRSSHRTSPPDSRSSNMHSSARNDWCRLAAFRRYPSVVPHASTYAARPTFDKELRYLSNLSMHLLYPWVKSKSIPIGHLPVSKLLLECRMDKYETRRQNLLALLHSRCGGRAATLADLIDSSPSYVSRMLYPDGKNGKKRIGEDVRDRIEDAFSLRRGSLDEDIGSAESAPNESRGQDNALPTSTDAPAARTNIEIRAETTLERLDSDEKDVLDLYRRATDKGKVMIKSTAVRAPKTDS